MCLVCDTMIIARDEGSHSMRVIFVSLIVGTVFWQVDDPQTLLGVIFQCVFFISMGAMLKVEMQLPIGVYMPLFDCNRY